MEWDILKQETLRNLTQVHQKKLRESKEILEKDHKAQLSIKQKEQEELLQIIEDQTEQILNWHQEKRKLEDDIYNSKNGQKRMFFTDYCRYNG